jgi:FAD/FMN-containing dehydrogenase
VLPEATPEAIDAAFRRLAFTGTRVFEQLPAALWPVLAPSPVSGDLARRTRAAFDPHRLLNPGILGESPAT